MNALSRPAALTASSIVAAFFFVVPHLAAAEALDFDDLSSDGGTGGLPAVNSPCFGENGSCLAFLDERGYRFTSAADGVNDHAHLVSAPYFFGTQSWASNGTNYIGLDATNITFERIDANSSRSIGSMPQRVCLTVVWQSASPANSSLPASSPVAEALTRHLILMV